MVSKDEIFETAVPKLPSQFCTCDLETAIGHQLTTNEVSTRLSIMVRRGELRVAGRQRYNRSSRLIYEKP